LLDFLQEGFVKPDAEGWYDGLRVLAEIFKTVKRHSPRTPFEKVATDFFYTLCCAVRKSHASQQCFELLWGKEAADIVPNARPPFLFVYFRKTQSLYTSLRRDLKTGGRPARPPQQHPKPQRSAGPSRHYAILPGWETYEAPSKPEQPKKGGDTADAPVKEVLPPPGLEPKTGANGGKRRRRGARGRRAGRRRERRRASAEGQDSGASFGSASFQ